MADEYISRKSIERVMSDALIDRRFATGYDYAILTDIISDLPPADVQPVKHGRWIPHGGDMWLCSNCKENIIFSMSESDRTEKQRYCCRCGARMDLKDGDAE